MERLEYIDGVEIKTTKDKYILTKTNVYTGFGEYETIKNTYPRTTGSEEEKINAVHSFLSYCKAIV